MEDEGRIVRRQKDVCAEKLIRIYRRIRNPLIAKTIYIMCMCRRTCPKSFFLINDQIQTLWDRTLLTGRKFAMSEI